MSNSLLVSGSAILTLFLVMAAGGQPGYQAQVVYDRPKPEATPPAEHVAELIAVLSDDALEARRSARRALLAMGAGIQGQLQWALERERQALPAIDLLPNGAIAGLHYAIAELTVLIDHCEQERRSAASTVTLHHTNAPLLEVLRDFGSQVDARVSISSRPDANFGNWLPGARASVDLDRVNYWSALRAIRQTHRGDSFELSPRDSAESGLAANVRQWWRRVLPADRPPESDLPA